MNKDGVVVTSTFGLQIPVVKPGDWFHLGFPFWNWEIPYIDSWMVPDLSNTVANKHRNEEDTLQIHRNKTEEHLATRGHQETETWTKRDGIVE